jgi:hypothetical protein
VDKYGQGRIKSPDSEQTCPVPSGDVSVGNAINGYGGGAFVVDANGAVVFTNGATGTVHRINAQKEEPEVILGSPNHTYTVVLLSHVGSTGRGSAHRDAMNGLWGVADV